MSITDKRIYKQAEKMQKYKWKFLYLKTGDYNQLDEIKQKAIETITLKLFFLHGIITIRVKGQTMLNYSLNKMVEFILNKDEIKQEHFIKTFGGFETDYDRVVMAVSCASGYGIKLGERTTQVFESIENMVYAKKKDFENIEGVGDIKAQNLYDFLHNKVKKPEKPKVVEGIENTW
jgi:ERCC4-type nuclease